MYMYIVKAIIVNHVSEGQKGGSLAETPEYRLTHQALTQYGFIVGPVSKTVNQH